MSWNYRVVKYTDGEGTTHFGIHEVYYDKAGYPTMYTEGSCRPYGETLEELQRDIEHMTQAFARPVLTEADFKKEEQEKTQ